MHVEKVHCMTKLEYGDTSCSAFTERKRELNNWDWLGRLKKEDPTRFEEWRQGQGKRVSDGIMRSPSARKARADNMTALNKTAEQRQISSETAKKTSARPDVIEKRTKNLARWREENPELFQENTIKMIGTKQSKPEKLLFEVVTSLFPALNFKRNQQIKHADFKTTKSGKRQIDMLSASHRVVVEFDGVRHFIDVQKNNALELNKRKDVELNKVLSREGYTLVRISHDQFKYSRGGYFIDSCVIMLKEIITRNSPGVFKIGKAYTEGSSNV